MSNGQIFTQRQPVDMSEELNPQAYRAMQGFLATILQSLRWGKATVSEDGLHTIDGWEAMGLKIGDPMSRGSMNIDIKMTMTTIPGEDHGWAEPLIFITGLVTTEKEGTQ